MVMATLSYLGVQGEQDEKLLRLVSDCLREVHDLASPRHVLRFFNPEEAGELLVGTDIKSHLKDAKIIGGIAATLGVAVDTQIKKYQIKEMSRAVTLDAAAAAYIENYCDGIDLSRDGLFPTMRFSPGYGDYPLAMQEGLIRALQAEKIGITRLQSQMLLPSKSITALFGLCEKKQCTEATCKYCNQKDCNRRRT